MTTLFTVDGRTIEACLLGNGHTTVLFFHGFGSSAKAIPVKQDLFTQNDVQLLCFNRPGIGNSTLANHYTVHTIAANANALLEQQNISQCVVAGWSSGGLFAQAFAQAHPEKVSALHLLSSAIPFAMKEARNVVPGRWKTIQWMNRWFPFAAKELFRRISKEIQANPAHLMERSIPYMVAVDQEVARDSRYASLLQAATLEGFANRGRGVLHEAKAITKAVIDYHKITCPVHIWTGEQDTIWPPATAGYLLKQLPQSHLHIFRNSGHLLCLKEWEKIVAAFAAAPVC